ncbi:MAG TPA: ABC transporter ATP-binding protein [Pirellulales bacterium]|jgi:branched-chain amino acid transport system ATP-binding protein|nr:ABC transporter ATP-binding protein [Pirellulales bacterium]
MGALLAVEDFHAGYGAIEVLRGISLEVAPGEIVALIGANGAGKTTTLLGISGCLAAARGRVVFDGRQIERLATHQIMRLGICHVPEGRKIFPRLSVAENLQMGAFSRRDRAGIERDFNHACELFPILAQRRSQLGGTLSGGEQQMLAVARALMGRPKLLLLDEPSLGLAPLIVVKIFEVVRKLNQEGMAVLLVEQAARMALKLAHRGYVMETGQITMSGSAQSLLGDKRVQDAYLGQ